MNDYINELIIIEGIIEKSLLDIKELKNAPNEARVAIRHRLDEVMRDLFEAQSVIDNLSFKSRNYLKVV